MLITPLTVLVNESGFCGSFDRAMPKTQAYFQET
jgi:hypothetical protein